MSDKLIYEPDLEELLKECDRNNVGLIPASEIKRIFLPILKERDFFRYFFHKLSDLQNLIIKGLLYNRLDGFKDLDKIVRK